MNNKLGSEFIDDFEKEEAGLFGVSYRHILLWFSVFSLMILIIVVVIFEFPEIIFYTYGALVTLPGTLIGASADKKLKIKERVYFFFLEKRRVFRTDIENTEERR